MGVKYVLVALLVACSQNLTLAHILPSRHDDFSLAECMRSLTRHLLHLCSTYSDLSSELLLDNGMPLIPREMADRGWEPHDRVLQTCCMRPCSASELLATC